MMPFRIRGPKREKPHNYSFQKLSASSLLMPWFILFYWLGQLGTKNLGLCSSPVSAAESPFHSRLAEGNRGCAPTHMWGVKLQYLIWLDKNFPTFHISIPPTLNAGWDSAGEGILLLL